MVVSAANPHGGFVSRVSAQCGVSPGHDARVSAISILPRILQQEARSSGMVRAYRSGWMTIGVTAAVGLGAALASPAFGDVLDDWNQALLETYRHTGGGPGFMARTAAMTHGAMFDAINSVRRTHTPIFVMIEPTRHANR